jgi:F0F1-type ATP synthase assembly protein I
MAQASSEQPTGDPWAAFGLLVSGVAFYGFIGWLLDRWWGTSFMVVVGILLGAALGTWATWARFKAPPDPVPSRPTRPTTPH